jgi:hypothetical protein
LSDLHRGAAAHAGLWSTVRDELHRDLREMLDNTDKIHLVLFSGDLTNAGTASEFDAFSDTVEELGELFERCGSSPLWLSVPGNHDLLRPSPSDPAVRVLENDWARDPLLRSEFWQDANSPYRELVTRAFTNYTRWSTSCPPPRPAAFKPGVMPGDFSATIEGEGCKLGVLGLNTAFLQLTKQDYEGRLWISAEQAELACPEDLPTWTSRHDACFLLTHHPPSWLASEPQDTLRSEIYPPGRFLAHLFGHMHVPSTWEIKEGGSHPRRYLQSASAFGLKLLGCGRARIHGYSLGELNFSEQANRARLWPRVASKVQAGDWRLGPDSSLGLDRDDGFDFGSFERPNGRFRARQGTAPSPSPPVANPSGTPNDAPAAPGARPPTLEELVASNLSKWALVAVGSLLPLEGELRSPITLPPIRSPMLGDYDTKKVADYLFSAGETRFLARCREYERIIDNGNFDPRAEYMPRHFFVPSRSFPQLDIVLQYLDAPELKQNLALVGPKGSGKTLHQNCWLQKNNDQLEARRTIWLRCDCHRLFESWHRSGDFDHRPEKLVGLEDYLSLKLLYVLAKRGGDPTRQLLNEALVCLQTAGSYDEPVGNGNAIERRRIWAAFQQVRATIERVERTTRPTRPWYRYLEDEVISRTQRTTQGKEYRKWCALSVAIENVLQESGFRFVRILDGIDNIHATSRRWSRAYVMMINEAASFIGYKPGPARFNVAVLRQRSYLDVKHSQTFPSGRPEQLALRTIDLIPTDPYQVQQARLDFWLTHRSPDVSEFDSILESVGRLSFDDPPDRYHYNHRAFLHNRLTLIRQVYYRLLQLGHGKHAEQDSIDAQVRNLSDRNLLLNGRFFYDTANDWAEMDQEIGECSFNPFHLGPDSGSSLDSGNPVGHWGGVMGCHVLQCCRVLQMIVCNRGVTHDQIDEYLGVMFDYDKEAIERALVLLRAFGMIDSAQATDGPIAFEVSPAGERFLTRAFTDVDTLYYCALDTPIPSSIVEAGLIRSHSNKLRVRSGYPSASVITAFTFLTFLTFVGAKENSRLATRVARLSPKLKALQFDPALPHEDRSGQQLLRRSFKAALASVSADDRESKTVSDFFAALLATDAGAAGAKATATDAASA